MALNFLFTEPSVSFRAVKRKGALRYIASNRRGSLGAITQFAPPTKRVPKLLMGLLGLIDFRFPLVANSIRVSEDFLKQVSVLLEIPVDRIGIYVGEPNERRKLVATDIAGKSKWVLKLACGSFANIAIQNELFALEGISHEGHKEPYETDSVNSVFSVRDILNSPEVRRVDPPCGHEAILIERVVGRQLTPKEFEAAFFAAGASDWLRGAGGQRQDESVPTVGEWLGQTPVPSAERLTPLVDACRQIGALSLRSPLGVVHGDFAPWNIIQREAVSQVDSEANSKKLKAKGSSLIAIDWEFSRAGTPLVFDLAYAAWCFDELLGRTVSSVDSNHWKQLISLGALWKELRQQL